MTMPAGSPEERVDALWRRVATHLGLAALSGTVAALAGLLLLSWLAGSTSLWQRPSVFPVLFWLTAFAAAGGWLWRIGRRTAGWDRRTAAKEIEARAGLPRGSLRGAIEPGLRRPGTSAELVELHRQRVAAELEGRRDAALGDVEARTARDWVRVALIAATATVIATTAVWLGARESATEAWAAVWHPVRHLRAAPLPAIRISAEALTVRRGHELPVSVDAPGRDSAALHWRPRGDVADRRWYMLSEGRTDARIPRVESPTLVWAATADGAASDTLRVEPVDPLLLIDVRVDLRFPPHTGRERESFSSPLPELVVPAGTRATVSGKTTRPVESASLRSPVLRTIPLQIAEARRFSTSFRVQSGSWGWDIKGAQGEALEGDPDSLRFLTVADSIPWVRITYPGVDTLLDPGMTQPLLIEAGDDYSLSRLELVSWRVSAWGEAWPQVVESLVDDIGSSRASLSGLIDARNRGFLPGDTLHYLVRGYDNAPEPQLGMSREYVLRLPSLDEVRDRAITEARDLVEKAERLAEGAREHQEKAEALERSTAVQPAPGTQQRPEQESVAFGETEAARQALEEANSLLEQSRELQESLRQLQETIEQAGLDDPDVLERLREIQSLYERILTPELESKLESLRQALVDLEPEQIREAIRQLAEGSVDFRERVERSVELLRRAALEQEFQTLETEAAELGAAHEQLAEDVAADGRQPTDSTTDALEDRAGELARQAEELSKQIAELAQELMRAAEEAAAEHAAEAERAAAEAAQSDQQVANSLRNQPRRANAAARRALERMRQASAALQEGRQQMQEDWRQEVVEAMERARTEALELARRQQGLNETLNSSDAAERAATRSEQAALRRGVEQIERQLSQASESSLLVDPALVEEAADVGQALDALLGQLADGTREGRANPQLGQQASEALQELAYRLMQSSEAASLAQSGTGLQEALAQLAQLAEQQGQLNAESGGLTPGAADALLQELQRLAGQQRGIAQELSELNRSLGPRGQVLGELNQLAEEAEDLADNLERGRLDEATVDRQQRLYHRLLDAGRSLEQDELERERRAERPSGIQALRPGALAPGLLQGPSFPHPDTDALKRYPPALRRLILEYFDRLNTGEKPGGS